MNTNYYLGRSREQPTERWEHRKDDVLRALRSHDSDAALDDEDARTFVQDILDALGVAGFDVVETISGQHLGGVSSAGLYCTRCDMSCITGERGGRDVRNPHAVQRDPRVDFSKCPRCNRTDAAQGVSSFTYAMRPEEIAALPPDACIEDEHGRTMTVEAFRRDVLGTVKFEFTDKVGTSFS